MNKRIWTAPEIAVVQFAANEYVANCWNNENRLYKFICNATQWLDESKLGSGSVYAEVGDLNQQNKQDVFYHANAWANDWFGNYQSGQDYNDFYKTEYKGSDQLLSNNWGNHRLDGSAEFKEFHVDSSEIHNGWIVNTNTANTLNPEYTSIFIWHGQNGDEIHAMLNDGVTLEVARS